MRKRCTKKRYPDRVAALLALSSIAATDSSTRAKSEKRAYPCPRCKGWHLTSTPLRKKSK